MTNSTRLPSGRASLGRLGVAIAFAAASVLTLSGCGAVTGAAGAPPALGTGTSIATKPMELRIVSARWNGWDVNYRPTPTTSVIPATVGAKGSAEMFSDAVTITVTGLSSNGVEISVSEQMAPTSPGGGVSLNATQTVFTIQPGKPASFVTPTLDSGMTYTVSLVAAGSTVITPAPTTTTRVGPPPCGCDLPSPPPSA